MTLDRWKKAIVHLECAADELPWRDHERRIVEAHAALARGELSAQQFSEAMRVRGRELRYHGTALYVVHRGRRYLVTARHVLFDEVSAHRELALEQQRMASRAENASKEVPLALSQWLENRIFGIIFPVPSLNEVLLGSGKRGFLMNLGSGSRSSLPYTFSTRELDLAVISLDQRHSEFADELEAVGHMPISSSDIADGPSHEGEEIFTIGFPRATALLGQVEMDPRRIAWASQDYSLPVSAFGRVSMLHEALSYFWADLSVFPGNSGGPVVSGDRLVGIVSSQANEAIDSSPDFRARIPFGKVVRSGYIFDLLAEQERKDRPWRGEADGPMHPQT